MSQRGRTRPQGGPFSLTSRCRLQAIAIASSGPDRASSGRLRCMERDSGSGTAAFNGCRSAVGADCALAEAWSSSACGPTADALGSTREGQASTRSILSRQPPQPQTAVFFIGRFVRTGRHIVPDTASHQRQDGRDRKEAPDVGSPVLVRHAAAPARRKRSAKSDGKSSASDSDGGNIQKCETRRRLARASDRGPVHDSRRRVLA